MGSNPTAGIGLATKKWGILAGRTWSHARRRIGVALAIPLTLNGVTNDIPGTLMTSPEARNLTTAPQLTKRSQIEPIFIISSAA